VPHINKNSRGAHIVTIAVDTPTKLTKEQKEILESLRGS
jgi:molecular chaperone DnaJ